MKNFAHMWYGSPLAKNFNLISFFNTLLDFATKRGEWKWLNNQETRGSCQTSGAEHTHSIILYEGTENSPCWPLFAPIFPLSTEFADAVADARRDAMRQNKNQNTAKPRKTEKNHRKKTLEWGI